MVKYFLFSLFFFQTLFAVEVNKSEIFRGRVIDQSTNLGIPEAIIELKNSNLGVGYYKVETDKLGYFEIKNFIFKINYKLTISKKGYLDFVKQDYFNSNPNKFLLYKESKILGEVKNTKDKNLDNVEVTVIEGYYSQKRIHTTKTDKFGRYSFEKLENKSYILEFRKENFITETASIKEMKFGENFYLPMRLYENSSLYGKLKIESSETPADSINVILQNGKISHNVQTFLNGEFQIDAIKPGEYILKFSHIGFYEKVEKIKIGEGYKVKKETISLKAKEPSLILSANRFVFTPLDKISFDLKTFRLETVKVKIFELKSKDKSNIIQTRFNEKSLTDSKLVSEWILNIKNFRDYNWNYTEVELKEKLPTANYLIQISSEDEKVLTNKYFSITTVGILVKRSEEKLFLYASDFITNEPIKDAKIYLSYEKKEIEDKSKKDSIKENNQSSVQGIDESFPLEDEEGNNLSNQIKTVDRTNLEIFGEGVTDKNGLFEINVKNIEEEIDIVIFNFDGSSAYASISKTNISDSELNTYFAYTDRPIYRLGDEVHFKILAKERKNKFRPITNAKITVEIKNQDSVYSLQEFQLDEFGTCNGNFIIPNEKTGLYQIFINNININYFQVIEYRKPEFKIELNPIKSYYTNNEEVEFKVEAKYFFGSPMSEALVSYKFYEEKVDQEKRFTDNVNQSYFNRELKLEGSKNLDENGINILKFNSKDLPYSRKIILEVSISDKSNIKITENKSVYIRKGDFYISINSDKNYFFGQEKKKFLIETKDFNQKPISTEVQINFHRFIWKPHQRIYSHEEKPLVIKKIKTDKNGLFELEISDEFNFSGEFDVLASSVDIKGNIVKESKLFWNYFNNQIDTSSKLKNLEISLANEKLNGEDQLEILIKSKFKDSFILLTLEGKEIFETRLVKMEGNFYNTKIKIKPEYSPNLFIKASLQKNKSLYVVSHNYNYPEKDTNLKISIKTDKEKYSPREKMKLEIDVTNEIGKPEETDLSIAVVDESIFKITEDHTPIMQPYFYKPISNWVTTTYSYPISFLAGASKDLTEEIVRKNFKDTAFWIPNLKTDKNGKAGLEVQFPDNLTEWRITSRGHDKSGRVGEVIEKKLVTKDLVLRLAKPRFLIEGDEIELLGIINNNSNDNFSLVETEFKINDKKITKQNLDKISLATKAATEEKFRIKVPNSEFLKVEYKANVNDKIKDAIEIKIPIYKNSIEWIVKEFGTQDQKNIKVKLNPNPSEYVLYSNELKLNTYFSQIEKLFLANKSIQEFPYSCIEQTTNKILPSLKLQELYLKLMAEKNTDTSSIEQLALENLDFIQNKSSSLKEKIQNSQNYDGSFGWWDGGKGNEFLTSYLIESSEILEIREINKSVKFAKKYLENNQNIGLDEKAYLLFALAKNSLWSEASFKSLENKNLSNFALSYFIRAINLQVKQNRKSEMNADNEKVDLFQKNNFKDKSNLLESLIKELLSRKKADSNGVYFESEQKNTSNWQGSDIEITALTLQTFMEVDSKLDLNDLANSLLNRIKGDSWGNTKETARVIWALSNFYLTKKNLKLDKTDLNYYLNEKLIHKIDKSKNEILDKNKIIKLDSEKMEDLNFQVQLKENTNFSFGLTFKNDLLPISNNSKVEKLNQGLSIKKEFFGLKRIRDKQNSEYFVPFLLNLKEIQIGDEILVKLKIKAKKNYSYLMLEDFIPSGFEIVKTDAYDGIKNYTFSEIRDNRVIYFFEKIHENLEEEISFILRTELSGEFSVRPAKIHGMYSPEIRGYSEFKKIKVVTKNK